MSGWSGLQWIVAVVGIVVFAGCVGNTEAGGQATSAPDPQTLPPVDGDEARIIGTVTDDALAPVAGAQVGILNVEPSVVVTTNPAGQFALVGLKPGPYTIAVGQLGYDSVTRQVEALAGQVVELNIMLSPIPVDTTESRFFTIIGEGYFACGAEVGVDGVYSLAWGNLHACVFDNHKPNVTFDAPKAGLTGIMDEVIWQQTSGLTSQRLAVSFVYGHSCTPFCESQESWNARDGSGDSVSSSPVRFYVPFTDEEKEKVAEDPMPLKSVTFPDRDDQNAVIVFQQRMTHYITLFWGPLAEETVLEDFTAIPDY